MMARATAWRSESRAELLVPLDVAPGVPTLRKVVLPWFLFGGSERGSSAAFTIEKRAGSDAGPTLRPSRELQCCGGVLLESIDTVSLVRARGGCVCG